MDIGVVEIIGAILVLFITYYYYLTSKFHFWKNRGIPGPKPIPIYGNFKDVIFGKVSLSIYIKQEYDKYKDEPMFGIFVSRSPVLIINDPEIIKDVLVKNFSTFPNRGIRIFEKVEPLSANLINLEVARWRPLRAKQTTMFTFAKLKEMFYLLLECANNLDKTLSKMIENNDVIECCEVTSRFTTDVIGVTVFGIDMKALEDENSQFRKIGKKFIYSNKWMAFKLRFKQICPFLYNLLAPIMYDYEINDFFINSMTQTMEYRKKNNIRRSDFVDLLNDLRDNPSQLEGIELTDTLLTAQAFAFFFAGFETSSTTMSHALYELALNQTIQNKLREEINNELLNCNGELKIESMKSMHYLDKVMNETLRKYPIATILTRESVEPYTFSKLQLTIPKNTKVWIPLYGIHRDPNIYPNPDTFDPERFDEESVKQRHSSHYLPFGTGPRNCIGARFGQYQTKIGLITILKSYKIEVCDATPIPYVSNARRFLLGPAAGIHLKFSKIV